MSVGRKPLPAKEMSWPEPLNEITGSDWTVMSAAFAAEMTNAQIRSVPRSVNRNLCLVLT